MQIPMGELYRNLNELDNTNKSPACVVGRQGFFKYHLLAMDYFVTFFPFTM